MTFYDDAEKIADARKQWHDDLKQANRDGPTGTFVDELFTRSDALDAEIEQLRRQYFPRAHRLVITASGACTVSPTGRSIRTVWERQRESY